MKHFIVKNGCTNSYERGAQTGMDQKINGRTDGSREQRLKMLERKNNKGCTFKLIFVEL